MHKSLSHKLYADAAYTDLARLVGYNGVPYPLNMADAGRLYEKHTREKMCQVADEILDYDRDARLARLKASVRKLCFGMLGPAPEDEDWYYRNPDGTPSERPRKSEPAAPRDTSGEEKPEEYWSPCTPVEEAKPIPDVPRRMVPPPEMTADEMLRKLDDDALLALIEDAKVGVAYHGPNSHAGRQLKRDIVRAEAEGLRRREEAGQPSEIDLIRIMHGTKLRKLLLGEHGHFRNYPAGHHFHVEAIRRMDLLEAEMRRRGNKVPPRPNLPIQHAASSINLSDESDDDIDLVAQVLANTIEIETDMGCIVAHPDEIRCFREATTHRLRELLDMNQYEVAKYGPDTVTHQDAARDIVLIEFELNRRNSKHPGREPYA